MSFLWSACRSDTERGKRHSMRDVSEAGVWLRYDFTFGNLMLLMLNLWTCLSVLYSANYCYWGYYDEVVGHYILQIRSARIL